LTTLTKRILTAAVLVALLLAALFLAPPPISIALFAVVVLVGGWEWSGFLQPASMLFRLLFLLILTLLVISVFVAGISGVSLRPLLYLAAAWWLVVTVWLLRGGGQIPRALIAPAGFVCLVPAWYSLFSILGRADGPWLLVWIVLLVAAADIGAYFSGRAFGRNKLAPTISPGKTREGLYGGLVSAVLVGAVGAWQAGIPVIGFALAAVLLALVSVSGDLLISAFKRNAGLKDSGKILPGHGGVLDRVDGLIAALPLYLLVLDGLSVTGLPVVNKTAGLAVITVF
jgi:phosphatidate cytidylyltransferase